MDLGADDTSNDYSYCDDRDEYFPSNQPSDEEQRPHVLNDGMELPDFENLAQGLEANRLAQQMNLSDESDVQVIVDDLSEDEEWPIERMLRIQGRPE